MKKMAKMALLLAMAFGLVGCATLPFPNRTTTVVVQPLGSGDPAGDAYKSVLITNPGPFWVLFPMGIQKNVVLAPGAEVVTERVRPLGSLSPSFGQGSFIAYAYRRCEQDGQGRLRLDEFVGQAQFSFFLSGYPVPYNGRVFGAVVVMSGFPVSTFGHPESWSGSIFGIIPWELRFLHQ